MCFNNVIYLLGVRLVHIFPHLITGHPVNSFKRRWPMITKKHRSKFQEAVAEELLAMRDEMLLNVFPIAF